VAGRARCARFITGLRAFPGSAAISRWTGLAHATRIHRKEPAAVPSRSNRRLSRLLL